MQTNVLVSFENSFSLAANQVLLGIVSFLPNILGALVLFLIGWIIADILKSLAVKIVNITKLGSLFKNPAVDELGLKCLFCP